MFRRQRRLTGFLLPVTLVALNLFVSQALAQKAKETVTNFAPLSLSLTADSTAISACAEGNQPGPQVRLNAQASSPGGYPLRYRWSTNSGHIEGDGATVTWDLSGLKPGYYKAFVEVETGSNDNACLAFTSTSVLINPCPPPPSCPKVKIICPNNAVVDQPLTFSSNVAGVTSAVAPIYNWTVSAGTIIEGQGTSSIKVATTGLAGQTIRATLHMGGYTLDCSDSCAAEIPIPLRTSRKFDEFPSISRNDEKARLDNYAVELQNDQTATAYIIVYPGRSGPKGEVQNHTSRIVDYLVNSRGIDARRIVVLVGGTRDELMEELWISPQGARPPTP
jgi:hypothetical protein